jgi:hypothetical protein
VLSGAYSAEENRKKGDVSRKANADGSDARARAPKRVFAMAVRWNGGGAVCVVLG